jgi:hypothetical protein
LLGHLAAERLHSGSEVTELGQVVGGGGGGHGYPKRESEKARSVIPSEGGEAAEVEGSASRESRSLHSRQGARSG